MNFDDIYNQYFKHIYLFIKGLTKNKQLAEEITQETFFKALKSINKFKGDCDIRVWLCQIAKNTYYSYCKKNKLTINDEFSYNLPDNNIPILEKLSNEAEAFKIHQYLHTMKKPYKEVFSLRIFSELSFKKIGEIFGKSESWARVTYYRAKKQMKGKEDTIFSLEETGYSITEDVKHELPQPSEVYYMIFDKNSINKLKTKKDCVKYYKNSIKLKKATLLWKK